MDQGFSRLSGTTALLLTIVSIPASAQLTFTEFPLGTLISDMSADGSVVVGAYDDGINKPSAFRWTASGGIELIGVDGIFDNLRISRDASTIVGTVPDSKGCATAAIWKGGKNWMLLPSFVGVVPSEQNTCTIANAVSADGSVIAGSAYVSLTKAVAFRWDAQNGMVNLGTFDDGSNADSSVYNISADGKTIVGWDYKPQFSPPGPAGVAMNGRRGAIWWDGRERLVHAFGWAGEAWATNDVGSIIVGQFHPLDQNNSVVIGHGASTYLYTAWDGSFADLGAVAIPLGGDQHEYISQPYGVSDDGSVVAGETGRLQKLAMIWTPSTGMMYVTDYLTQHGVTSHAGWYLLRTVYVSPDGRTIAGLGQKLPSPSLRSWIATVK